MRILGRWTIRSLAALALVMAVGTPALARVAAIRTAAPIADSSDAAVEAAFVEAVEAAVRGAVAMGLSRVALRDAVVLQDAVLVEIVATDADVAPGEEGASTAETGRRIEARADQPAR
jgi:hypothetical protein